MCCLLRLSASLSLRVIPGAISRLFRERGTRFGAPIKAPQCFARAKGNACACAGLSRGVTVPSPRDDHFLRAPPARLNRSPRCCRCCNVPACSARHACDSAFFLWAVVDPEAGPSSTRIPPVWPSDRRRRSPASRALSQPHVAAKVFSPWNRTRSLGRRGRFVFTSLAFKVSLPALSPPISSLFRFLGWHCATGAIPLSSFVRAAAPPISTCLRCCSTVCPYLVSTEGTLGRWLASAGCFHSPSWEAITARCGM